MFCIALKSACYNQAISVGAALVLACVSSLGFGRYVQRANGNSIGKHIRTDKCLLLLVMPLYSLNDIIDRPKCNG